LPSLNAFLKKQLLSASAKALSICSRPTDRSTSFRNLHLINSRATPHQFSKYKHALLLYNLYNLQQPPKDWISLNLNQVLTSRQTHFEIIRDQNYKIGSNKISNRIATLNKQIPLAWLNLSRESFKTKIKQLYL
jgi:hypothetical protein